MEMIYFYEMYSHYLQLAMENEMHWLRTTPINSDDKEVLLGHISLKPFSLVFVSFCSLIKLLGPIEVVIVGEGVKPVLNASVKPALMQLMLQDLVRLFLNLHHCQIILIFSQILVRPEWK